jgi:hypothetical protein
MKFAYKNEHFKFLSRAEPQEGNKSQSVYIICVVHDYLKCHICTKKSKITMNIISAGRVLREKTP